jgi:hypothetical protein
MALALGRPVHGVSVQPNRDRLGHCEFRKGVYRPTEDWVEREMLIALGGIAAEAIHTGTYGWSEAERDLDYARSLAEQRAGRRQADRLERRMLAKAEHLLAKPAHWRTVEMIADELLRRGEISGRAARDLFDRAGRET